jgi:hypothetical protein
MKNRIEKYTKYYYAENQRIASREQGQYRQKRQERFFSNYFVYS